VVCFVRDDPRTLTAAENSNRYRKLFHDMQKRNVVSENLFDTYDHLPISADLVCSGNLESPCVSKRDSSRRTLRERGYIGNIFPSWRPRGASASVKHQQMTSYYVFWMYIIH
jgi:hypothetical protein